MRIHVAAETQSWEVRPPDPNDTWDNGDSEGEVTNVWASVEKSDDYDYSGASLTVDLPVKVGDTIYAVVADYSSGSTFGRAGGYVQVIDAFSEYEIAKELAGIAKKCTGFDFSFYRNGKKYKASWTGYFEDLNNIQVWETKVLNTKQYGRHYDA